MRLSVSWAKDFLKNKLRGKGYSEKTISGYLYSLNFFEKFLLTKNITDLRHVEEKTIKEYTDYLIDYVPKSGKGKKKGSLDRETRNMYLSKIKKLFNLLIKEDIIFSDPFRNTEERPKKKGLPKDILTEEEIEELFKKPDLKTYLGFRDRTVLEVMYGTGIRIGELEKLNVMDVDFASTIIFVRQGKGRKDRIVPCTKTAFMFLREYLAKVRPALSYMNHKEQSLFLADNGNRFRQNAFRKMLKKYLKQTNIMKQITAHSFRHTFATHMLEAGVNLRYIQEILGHEGLSTTQIYTRVAVVNLKQVVKQYHPRNNELYTDEEVQAPSSFDLMRHIKKED